MRVSVIVPTYRRPELLRRCLEALERQDRPADEVLVVVRSDDGASHEVVGAQRGRARLVPVARPGVIAAMNAGVDASTGDVVAMTDDDAEPHRDWLARILATYARDPGIAAVGGRDWIYGSDGQLRGGSARVVGVISWFGRTTGNHHLGTGPARDVDVLKGVNLSVKGDLLRRVRVDERLRDAATDHNWELNLCLTLRGLGLRIVYDPAIGVDHHAQPRADDSREFTARGLREAAHNETVAVLDYLRPWQRPVYLAWAIGVGTRTVPGVAQAIRLVLSGGTSTPAFFLAAQTGWMLGLRTHRRSRGERRRREIQRIW